jgi:signal transduction histidine kinase/ligand-binding sensor domain-containing protein/CheY-like chemotaxis protein
MRLESKFTDKRIHTMLTGVMTCFILIISISPARVQARDPDTTLLPPKVISFEHLTTDDGLASPVVMGIVQDEQGFMWFGTTNGISRFDGYTFINYPPNPDDPNDPTTVGAAVVTNLLIDSEELFWIATYGGGVDRYDAATDRFIHYRHDPADPGSIAHNIIQTMSEDSHGNLWFATIGGGLNRYDRMQDRFIRYRHNPDNPDSIASDKTYNVLEDSQGILWVAVANGIDRFDREHNRFIHYRHDPADLNSLSSSLRWTIAEDHLGTLWLNGMDGGGLVRYDRENDHFIRYKYDPDDRHSISVNSLRNSFEDSKGTLWIATMGGGVNVYDREQDRFIRYQHDPNKAHSIIYNDIIKVYEDRSGVLWFSTFGGGISKYDRKTERFKHIRYDLADPNSLSHTDVHSIFQDSRGDFWIGTADGLNKYDPRTETFIYYRQEADNPKSLSGNFVRQVAEDAAGFLWITTPGQGLNKYDPYTEAFTHYKHDPDDVNSLAENVCYGIFYDDEHNELWIGQQSHVSKYVIATETFTHYDTTSFIEAIHKDRSGNIWLGGGAGLFTYNREQDTLERILDRSSTALAEDRSGNLWVGTTHGLSMFNRNTGAFIRYAKEDGLIDNSVMGILDDGDDGLWISTGRGLSHFNISNETFRNYYVGAFNRGRAFHKSTSGEIFFGGPNGITRFFHGDIADNPYTPAVVLTSFSKFNEEVKLEAPVSRLKHLDLTYRDRVFSFEFAALDYSEPTRNRYKYKLEGFDKAWLEVESDRRFATYTNLDAGDYVFRVIGSNNDGVWNEEGASIKITITPPWWQTMWFRLLAVLLGISLLVGGFRWRVRTVESRNRELERQVAARTRDLQTAKEQAENAKEQAETANQAKSIFLANMSHELRTPLNAVLGFSEILFHRVKEPGNKNYLKSIQTSGKALLSLINDVLDLSKIEAGKMEPNYTAVSLGNLCHEMRSIFQHKINVKGLEFQVRVDDTLPEVLLLDETRLRQVLMNLLSNAAKFTDEGFVRLTCRQMNPANDLKSAINLIIEIADSGRGIAPEDQRRIFDAFEQVTAEHISPAEGTGLGLAITHNIVQLMQGTMSLESAPGAGAAFTIELPGVEIAADKIGETDKSLEFEADLIRFAAAKILIVDDIEYNRDVLAAYLDLPNITPCFATNGEQALEKTLTEQPDLILMDVKMPVMDGYDASQRLKSSPSTKEIPIIAVTASVLKQDEEKIQQYCDGYLRKPVNQFTVINEIKKFLKHTEKKEVALKTDPDTDLIAPPTEDVKTLYEIAKDGDMDEISAHLDLLEQKGTNVKAFCDRIRILASGYEYEKIIHLLRTIIEMATEDSDGKAG